MTPFPVLDIRFGPLTDVAREYTRLGASEGMRRATLELVHQVLSENRRVLLETMDVVSELMMALAVPLADAEDSCGVPTQYIDFVSQTFTRSQQLVEMYAGMGRVLDDAEDVVSHSRLLEECRVLCEQLAGFCVRLALSHPALATGAITVGESCVVKAVDARERSDTAAPLCVLVGGVGAAIGFCFGGALPAAVCGTALYLVAAELMDRALRRVVG